MNNHKLLACSMGVQITVTSIAVAFSGLAGVEIIGDPVLGTVPMTVILGTAGLVTAPASLFMERFGRAAGFALGSAIGAVGAGVIASSILVQNFPLLCLGSVLLGVYQATSQYYRFAATEGLPSKDKSRAVSYVMVGGIVAALLGPAIAIWTQALFTPLIFLGPFVVIAAALAINSGFFLVWRAGSVSVKRGGRRLTLILRDPAFLQATLLASGSYAIMTYVMISAPLAVVSCGFSPADAGHMIQWHLVAMFAPSLLLKHSKLGQSTGPTVALGCLALLVSIIILSVGVTMTNFVIGLIFLGIGWNFTYVGATSIIVTSIPEEDQARAQGANELVVWGAMAFASGISGWVLGRLGWTILLGSAILPLMLTASVAFYHGKWRQLDAIGA